MARSIKKEAMESIISTVEREIQYLEADLEEDARDKRLPKVITAMKSELQRIRRMFACEDWEGNRTPGDDVDPSDREDSQ